MSSMSPGADGPLKAMFAARSSPRSSIRWPSHGGTQPSVSSLGVGEARVLDIRVEVHDVDVLRAVPVGGISDGAGQLLLARARGDTDDLAGLHVGTVPDQQRGELFEVRGAGNDGLLADGAGSQNLPDPGRAGRASARLALC